MHKSDINTLRKGPRIKAVIVKGFYYSIFLTLHMILINTLPTHSTKR